MNLKILIILSLLSVGLGDSSKDEEEKWSKEDSTKTGSAEEESEESSVLSETEKVVEAIKLRFGNPDVIQIIEPPQLQQPLQQQAQNLQGKKFKLVLNQQQQQSHQMTPVEPITNLLNKRKEVEKPSELDGELFDEKGNWFLFYFCLLLY